MNLARETQIKAQCGPRTKIAAIDINGVDGLGSFVTIFVFNKFKMNNYNLTVFANFPI